MKKIIKRIKSFVIHYLYIILYKIRPRYAADLMYYHAFHKRMNLKNPKNLIEKINWLQFNSDTSLWTLCADKYRMREYVTEKGLQDYLPKLYGHWENPENIDFNALPNEFVLKSNNGCGTVKIVRDKKTLDIDAVKTLLKSWLKPYGYTGGQTHYLRIKPCIIAEELLAQSKQGGVISSSLIDYKLWCINGVPESFFVAYNRHEALKIDIALYDTKWNPLPQFLQNTNLEKYRPEVEIPVPPCLDEMLEIASKLAEPFPEVRVDFYIVNDKPVIGELTFTTGYGYFTDEYYELLGSKMVINQPSKKN